MADGDFFAKGYELYPEAVLAVSTFRDELVRRLKGVFEQRSAWGPFEPKPGGRPDEGETVRRAGTSARFRTA